jgi:hypothetical protein
MAQAAAAVKRRARCIEEKDQEISTRLEDSHRLLIFELIFADDSGDDPAPFVEREWTKGTP